MKKIIQYIPFLLLVSLLSSCIPEAPAEKDYEANLEALWTIIDERYCFLEEKGVDWDQIRLNYLSKLKSKEYNDLSFFYLLADMLKELRDGHVNLYSNFDTGSYSGWIDDSTKGLNIYARNRVLGGDLMRSGGMRYGRFVVEGHFEYPFGYLSYGSFMNGIGDMNFILNFFKDCHTIILDLRSNGGGLISNSDALASYFIKEKVLVGYSMHKVGPGRGDFSEPKPLYLLPNDKNTWTDKPVIILQDKGCYSACNDFLSKVLVADNVTTMGQKSGGGAGLPATAELPNGWRVRYSAVKSLDYQKRDIEGGIEPDIFVENDSYYDKPDADDRILKSAIKLAMEKVLPQPTAGTARMTVRPLE